MQSHIQIVPFSEALKVWIRVALQSFGGPAGQIAVMHKIIVDEKRWIDNDRFLHALNYCMLLPGPEAQQLAIYIGWLLNSFKGGLAAGILFVLPGFLSILALSVVYALYQEQNIITALFWGLKAAVLAIVIDALIRISRKSLKTSLMYVIALVSFTAIFFFSVPFPLIILSAALIGSSTALWNKSLHFMTGIKRSPGQLKKSFTYLVKVISIFGGLWLLPVIVLRLFLGSENVFSQLGLFFSTAAVVTFGGAYAVLAFISAEAVNTYGWLKPGEMLDGLGMAETTPGPLIQVVQFVGFMGAYRLYSGDPLTGGILASVLVTWVTYVPSFLWIFAGAPFIEKLREVVWLNSALAAVTAAVTGVILNLSLWFYIHTAFNKVIRIHEGIFNFTWPVFSEINFEIFFLSMAAFILLHIFKWGMIKVLILSILTGLVFHFLL